MCAVRKEKTNKLPKPVRLFQRALTIKALCAHPKLSDAGRHCLTEAGHHSIFLFHNQTNNRILSQNSTALQSNEAVHVVFLSAKLNSGGKLDKANFRLIVASGSGKLLNSAIRQHLRGKPFPLDFTSPEEHNGQIQFLMEWHYDEYQEHLVLDSIAVCADWQKQGLCKAATLATLVTVEKAIGPLPVTATAAHIGSHLLFKPEDKGKKLVRPDGRLLMPATVRSTTNQILVAHGMSTLASVPPSANSKKDTDTIAAEETKLATTAWAKPRATRPPSVATSQHIRLTTQLARRQVAPLAHAASTTPAKKPKSVCCTIM